MKTCRPSELTKELQSCIDANLPFMIWGPSGVGKSEIVNGLARANDRTMLDFRANLMDPLDIKGIPFVTDNNRANWAAPSIFPLHDPMDRQKYLLFIDELPNAVRATQSALYQPVLDRMVGEAKLSENMVVGAAGNRMTDRGGTFEMPDPLKRRFIHFEVEPNVDDFITWALRNDIAPIIIAFLKFRPALLWDFDPDKYANPSPRQWGYVDTLIKSAKGGIPFLSVQGAVGEGAAGEFSAFVRTYENLPDLDALIANPGAAYVPSDDPATMHAICGALAAKADKVNFAAICKYTSRLLPEFQVILMRNTVTRNSELRETKEFNDWAAENANLIL